MFKHLMNGGSLKSLMLHDTNNDQGAAPTAEDERNRLRAEIAKNTNVVTKSETELAAEAAAAETAGVDTGEGDEEDEEGEEEEGDGEADPKVEETEEEKTAREAQEKIAAKAKRKDDRMQRRIDSATAQAKAAQDEIARLKAQLEANPEKKLTEAEVEARAEAKAAEKIAEKDLKRIQDEFDAECNKLQKGARKVDAEFDDKIADIAEQFGPIPSFMIGVLGDLDNGDEVLAHIANDDEVAEKIYSFKTKPAKMTKAIVDISTALADAKKIKPKAISKVPNPVAPVTGRRVQSAEITDDDTKPENMQNYARKRALQMEAARKARGY